MEREVPQVERTWGMLAHLSTFLGLVIPFGQILAPLGIWLGQRRHSYFVEDHARESLNFQISVTLYSLLARFFFRSAIANGLIAFINIYVVLAVLYASWQAHRGSDFRYDLSIRFVR